MGDKIGNQKRKILIACFAWYEGRLIYIDEYLKKHGYETLILLSDFSHVNKSRDAHFSGIPKIQYIHTREYKKNLSLSVNALCTMLIFHVR